MELLIAKFIRQPAIKASSARRLAGAPITTRARSLRKPFSPVKLNGAPRHEIEYSCFNIDPVTWTWFNWINFTKKNAVHASGALIFAIGRCQLVADSSPTALTRKRVNNASEIANAELDSARRAKNRARARTARCGRRRDGGISPIGTRYFSWGRTRGARGATRIAFTRELIAPDAENAIHDAIAVGQSDRAIRALCTT